MSTSAGCLTSLITMPFLAVWRGWVLSVLWLWFVVPSLNVPPLSIPAALGIALIVSMLTQSVDWDKAEKEQTDERRLKRETQRIVGGIFIPLFALCMGWIFRLFM